MRKYLYFLSILLILSNYGFSQNFESRQDIYSKYIIENGIPIIIDERIEFFGKVTDENVIGFIELLLLKMDTIKNNIENANNTKKVNSENLFQSKMIVIRNGRPSVELRNSQSRLVYDPMHEDSIKEGPRIGYVEYPDVDIISEIVDLINANYIFKIFINELKKKGLNIPINYVKILCKNSNIIAQQLEKLDIQYE